MSPPQIFISYHQRDFAAVEQVATVLARVGLRPWLDRWELAPGQHWESAFKQALESAAAVLALIGARPLSATGARTLERSTLVLVLLPGAAGLPEGLANLTTVDLREVPLDSAAGTATLLRALFGVLAGQMGELGERGARDRALSPDKLREAVERVRQTLGGNTDVPQYGATDPTLFLSVLATALNNH